MTTTAPTAPEYVGFVGCPTRGLLKVGVRIRAAHTMRVACPCGQEHVATKPMIRARRPDEEDVPLEEIPASAPPSDRHTIGDAAIFEAVPAEPTPAAEVAQAVGYVGGSARTALTQRLKRMNARAEREGADPPFVVVPGVGPSTPALVRRSTP
jgi:hypothetical protein